MSPNSPISASVFPPGQPTVLNAGPLLPALDTNIMFCFLTKEMNSSNTALENDDNKNIKRVNVAHVILNVYTHAEHLVVI